MHTNILIKIFINLYLFSSLAGLCFTSWAKIWTDPSLSTSSPTSGWLIGFLLLLFLFTLVPPQSDWLIEVLKISSNKTCSHFSIRYTDKGGTLDEEEGEVIFDQTKYWELLQKDKTYLEIICYEQNIENLYTSPVINHLNMKSITEQQQQKIWVWSIVSLSLNLRPFSKKI